MKRKTLILATTGMLTAVGVLLPQIFHAIPNAVFVLLPMHIPVLICGLLCGPLWGGVCGVITTVVSSLAFGMPVIPTGLVPMLFEMLTYGIVSGALKRVLEGVPKLKPYSTLLALISAMVAGRAVSIVVHLIMYSAVMGVKVTVALNTALASVFILCWPGILIQLFFIPAVMLTLKKTGLLEKYYGK